MARGYLGASRDITRGTLRGSTAILIGILMCAPGVSAAQENLEWLKLGDDGDGIWRYNNDQWVNLDDPSDEDFDELDNVTFGDVDDGNGYTVTLTAGQANKETAVGTMSFEIDDVVITRVDSVGNNRSLGLNGAITVLDDAEADQANATIELTITSGDLIKLGAGRLILTGDNTTTGIISVNEGRLNVNGSLLGGGDVTVAADAVLGGSGAIVGDITVDDEGIMVGALAITGSVTQNGSNSTWDAASGGSVSGLATLSGQTTANGMSFDGGVLNNGTGVYDVEDDTSVTGTFTNDGTVLKDGSDTVTLDGMTTFTNNEAITVEGVGVLNIGATTIDLNTDSTMTGTVNLTGQVNVNGTLDHTNTGAITGDVDVASGASFENVDGTSVSGTITSTGSVIVTDGTVADVVLNDGDGTFSGGEATGTIDVGQNGVVTGDVLATFDGDFSAGAIDLNGDATHNTDILVTGDSTLTVTGAVTALHDDLNAGDTTLTIDDGSTITAGSYAIGEDVDVENAGEIAGGTLVNNDGTINNAGTGVISAGVTNTLGLITNDGQMTGAIVINGGSLDNNNDISGGGASVTLNGDFAVLNANGGSEIAAGVVNTNGTINALGGNFSGGVQNQDFMDVSVNSSGSTIENQSSGLLDINDGITLDANVNQTAAGTVDINGIVDGDVVASAGDVDLNGEVTGTIQLTDGAATLTTGFLLDGVTRSTVTGLVTSEGVINATETDFDGGILANGGTVNVLGDISGTVTNDGGNVVVSAGRTIDGALDNDSGTTTQAGIVDGNASVDGGTFTNTGQITGNLLVTGGSFNNQLVTGQVDGTTTNQGGIINANGGSFGTGGVTNTSGTLNVNTSYALDVAANGGFVVIDPGMVLTGDFAQAGAATTNNGEIVDNITMTGGSLTNVDQITGAVAVDGGTLNMQLGSDISGTVTIDGGTVNANGGTFGSTSLQVDDGALNINASMAIDVVNAGGDIVMLPVTLTGDLDNQSGDATLAGTITGNVDVGGDTSADVVNSTANIGGQLALTGGRFNANGGTITGQVTNNGGNLRLNGVTLTTDIDNLSGTTRVIGNSTADIENLGGDIEVNSGTTLTGIITNTSGNTDNDGTIIGDLTIADGRFRNYDTLQGTVVASGGVVNAVSGEITGLVTNNGAEINATDTTLTSGVVNNSGEFDVRGDVTTTTVTNAGGNLFVRLAGDLDGDLVNTNGDAVVTGRARGTVDLSGGTLTTSGRIDGVTTVSGAGAMTANTGARFDETVQSTGGSISVAGEMQGDINNDGGTLQIEAAGELDGNVIQASNVTTNDGTILGTADITGGTFNQQSGSDTEMLTTLSNGTLNADGGAFSGGLLATGGTLSILGNTSGALENDGATVTIPGAFAWTGDVTNTSGDITVNGDIIGDAVFADGTGTFGTNSAVSGDLTQTGGIVEMTGGSFGGTVFANDGLTRISGDVSASVLVNNNGDLRVLGAGSLDQKLKIADGQAIIRGVVNGGLTVNGGYAESDGSITGKLVLRNDGVVDHTGSIGGQTNVSGGTLNANGGTFDKRIKVDGGTVNITSDTSVRVNVAAAVDEDADPDFNNLFVDAGVTLTGNVTNNGKFQLEGTVDGNLTNSGTTDFVDNGFVNGNLINTGTLLTNGEETNMAAMTARFLSEPEPASLDLDGPVIPRAATLDNQVGGLLAVGGANLQFGTITNAGDVTVFNGKVLLADTYTLVDGGTTTLTDGGLEVPDITGLSGSTLIMNEGAVEGTLDMAGDIIVRGGETSEMFGDIDLSGRGSVRVRADSTFDIEGALIAGQNTSTTLAAGSTIGTTDGFTQRGAMTMADGSSVEGVMINSGRIDGSGTLTFGGGLRNSGTVSVSGNASTDDRINVGGEGLTGGTYELDIDISEQDAGTSDRIVITSGILTGDVVLSFNQIGDSEEQDEDIIVIETNGADVSGLTVSETGLPADDGLLIYVLNENNAGDIVVSSGVNPGVSALAGSIVLTQSLIGSVVNRPTSPFVSGLAIEGENPCGAGVWARATGGQADTTGQVSQTNLTFDSSLSADYYGVQLGGDWACFEGFYNGWDMAFGGIAGTNMGSTSQPVFGLEFNASTGEAVFSDRQTSTTNVDFTQGYAGVYATAVKGPIALDLQYRVEQTDYEATNTGIGENAGLGLQDEAFSSDAQTLSGAIAYSIPLEDYDATFVPTAGFAYSTISTEEVNFGNLGTVKVEDFESQVGFVGGTLARTKIGDDGVSAINQFVTATIYNDFAEDPVSTFTPPEGSDRSQETIVSENLGTYGELSAGLSYVRILQPGEFGAVRQFNASVRADVRYSDQLESWGLTAQARLQF